MDIGKSGVYRYTESPDFAILLFGYAVDGSEVKVINLANGEKIPQEILDIDLDFFCLAHFSFRPQVGMASVERSP